jgi:heat shock protein HtpX
MNTMRTFVLMAALTLLLILVGQALAGERGAVFALILAGAMNFGAYWFSDRVVLAMYRAQEVNEKEAPELHAMVHELALRAGIPVPKVYVIQNDTPNAFATGRNPEHAAVAVTTGILRILNRDELMGVLGHELSHVQNRDILIGTIAATFAGAISMIASMAKWGAIFGGGRDDEGGGGGNILFVFLFSMVASLAALLIQLAISRSREYQADEDGARLVGEPRYLARALDKLQRGVEQVPMEANPATAHMFIVNPLRGGGVMSLFSTHPPMEKRIQRLLGMSRS